MGNRTTYAKTLFAFPSLACILFMCDCCRRRKERSAAAEAARAAEKRSGLGGRPSHGIPGSARRPHLYGCSRQGTPRRSYPWPVMRLPTRTCPCMHICSERWGVLGGEGMERGGGKGGTGSWGLGSIFECTHVAATNVFFWVLG